MSSRVSSTTSTCLDRATGGIRDIDTYLLHRRYITCFTQALRSEAGRGHPGLPGITTRKCLRCPVGERSPEIQEFNGLTGKWGKSPSAFGDRPYRSAAV